MLENYGIIHQRLNLSVHVSSSGIQSTRLHKLECRKVTELTELETQKNLKTLYDFFKSANCNFFIRRNIKPHLVEAKKHVLHAKVVQG